MQPASYLDLIVNFWKTDLEYSFSPMEVAIYFRLVDRCNSLAWKNPFGFKCDEFRAKLRSTNAESKKPFDTARNRLKQAGLIDFANGNGRGNVTQYTLTGIIKGIQKEPLSVPLSVPLSESEGCYINRVDKNRVENKSAAFAAFVDLFNSLTGKKYTGCKKAQAQFNARRKEGRTREDFTLAINNCLADQYHKETGHKYLTPEFITRSDKLEMYMNAAPVKKTGGQSIQERLEKQRTANYD